MSEPGPSKVNADHVKDLKEVAEDGTWQRKVTCDVFCKELVIPNRHKIMFTCLNIYFIGICFVYVFNGFYYWLYSTDIDPDNEYHLEIVCSVLFLTAAVVIVASILGTMGYFLGRIWMLRFMLGAHIFATMVFFGFSIYMCQYILNKVESVSRKQLEQLYNQYHINLEARLAVDYMQRRLECCGMYGPKAFSNQIAPISCCNDAKEKCDPKDQHQKVCFTPYYEDKKNELFQNVWFVVFIGFCHVFGGAATFFPVVMIKKHRAAKIKNEGIT